MSGLPCFNVNRPREFSYWPEDNPSHECAGRRLQPLRLPALAAAGEAVRDVDRTTPVVWVWWRRP